MAVTGAEGFIGSHLVDTVNGLFDVGHIVFGQVPAHDLLVLTVQEPDQFGSEHSFRPGYQATHETVLFMTTDNGAGIFLSVAGTA